MQLRSSSIIISYFIICILHGGDSESVPSYLFNSKLHLKQSITDTISTTTQKSVFYDILPSKVKTKLLLRINRLKELIKRLSSLYKLQLNLLDDLRNVSPATKTPEFLRRANVPVLTPKNGLLTKHSVPVPPPTNVYFAYDALDPLIPNLFIQNKSRSVKESAIIKPLPINFRKSSKNSFYFKTFSDSVTSSTTNNRLKSRKKRSPFILSKPEGLNSHNSIVSNNVNFIDNVGKPQINLSNFVLKPPSALGLEIGTLGALRKPPAIALSQSKDISALVPSILQPQLLIASKPISSGSVGTNFGVVNKGINGIFISMALALLPTIVIIFPFLLSSF